MAIVSLSHEYVKYCIILPLCASKNIPQKYLEQGGKKKKNSTQMVDV